MSEKTSPLGNDLCDMPDYSLIDNPIPEPRQSVFKAKPVKQFMAEANREPIPRCLFDEFWRENEVSILFSKSGVGKSALAVQIADAISYGKQINGFKMESDPQKVLYFDFELTKKQFELRYSESNDFGSYNDYPFSDNLIRVEWDASMLPDDKIGDPEYLQDEMLTTILEQQSKVVIVDNITYLKGTLEDAKDAISLVSWLKRISNEHKLSMLILAHTPKVRKYRIIQDTDLAGSAMLNNFVDGLFSIGLSQKDTSIRYLKNLKTRSSYSKYSFDKVAVCKYVKIDNFLQFVFDGVEAEKEHVPKFDNQWRDDLIIQAKELANSGMSQRDIGDKLNIAPSTVNKYLKKG